VLEVLGRKGDFSDNVLRVDVPRNDIHVKVKGMAVPTPFGFGGWVAMSRGEGGMEVMMGDLVLLQDEVNPVMSALLDHGLEVTALHNHFFWEEPRVFYMHVHGHGSAAEIAQRLKPALDLIGHVPGVGPPAILQETPPAAGTVFPGRDLDTAKLDAIVNVKGVAVGSVYKYTVGRPDLKVQEMGVTINTRMGLNSWAAITGTDTLAAIAGDIAMREDEVNSVLKALRRHNLEIVAIHHHMINSHPPVIFLHYWGTGVADSLADGFRAALDVLGKR